MSVPEDHNDPNGRLIQFPVVYFKTTQVFSAKSPVLHLGGGGPGGPMYLDYPEAVGYTKLEHDDYSLNDGRDLIVIDVRGTGQARPSLSCQDYVEIQYNLLNQNLSYREEWEKTVPAVLQCIDDYKRSGIDHNHYNSLAVAKDISLLANELQPKKFILFGVSYGSVYAQIIAKRFPELVESMVLDSAAFPQIPMHEDYSGRILAPYEALYNHCSILNTCDLSASETKTNIWAIYRELERNPIHVNVENYNTGEYLPAVLNGDRFIASIISGSYSMDIFYDMSAILEELKQGRVATFKLYFENYVSYLLNRQWGDISALAHYCYETKPFVDDEKMLTEIELLPAGYLRESTKYLYKANDFCDEMEITTADLSFADAESIEVPTLFLQGKHDSITPLYDLQNQRHLFPNSQVLTYTTAHAVISAEPCAEISAGKFVKQPESTDLSCYDD